eukprot:Gregarina_sp_Pseudo_9__5720@NODE_828_length_2156_cov_4_363722_g777_i0_p1_GENE_NODE_828_length_2156_cov_4_363722_g777_i0NODE_828_length_2156_cov_4_363722_g777_i0_p1_ORF_typecomplete_len530_score53_77DHHC/PF01529_20/4_8e03DHHC/PF01529_20/1_2e30Comm/PF15957_5/1_2e03Comm/PF15957_5/0_52_NODE_828_length_2156_cov_4_363722_g777_i05452134
MEGPSKTQPDAVVVEKVPNRFSCWRVVPVVLVLGYRLFVYGGILYINPSFLLWPTAYDCLLWVVAVVSVAFYMRTACANPGFQDWCPSKFLCSEEKKRAAEIKARLLQQTPAPRKSARGSQFLVTSDSSLDSSSLEPSDHESAEEGGEEEGSQFSDLENCAIDLGLDVPEVGVGGICVVRSAIGEAVPSDTAPQRKMRRLHTEMANAKSRSAPMDSLELSVDLPKGKTTGSLKKVRWRRWGLALAFLFRRVSQSLREWTHVCSAAYSTLWRSKDPRLMDDEGCRYIFSMGVHAMYQAGEKLQFCDKCKLWKLLRAKHCRSCNRCVRLHHHHCPWLGVCVGERNRVHFLWFLGWQTAELLLATGEIIWSVLFHNTEWMDDAKQPDAPLSQILPRIVLLVMIIVLGCLAIMTSCLFFYHAFLIGTNLTTWETMSWHKITYLKSKKKTHGSPFGSGTCKANCILAILPCLPEGKHRAQLLKIDPVDKILASRLVVGPGNSILWRSKLPGDSEYGRLPPCTQNPCCNLYDACL